MARKYFLPTVFVALQSVFAYGQQLVDVAESVVKIGIKGEELLFFGFAEGDQLIFSFEEANGRDMNTIEIVEMPSTSRFMDVKTSKIENKKLSVPKTAIYKFRFVNSAILPRTCRYKIQRMPASTATQKFNSTVYYSTFFDTTYVNEVENYLDRTDTVINNFADRTVKVNPLTAPGSSKACFNFLIPEEAVAWSFYISTNKGGQQVYADAAKTLGTNAASVIDKFPKYGPLAAVAIGAESYLKKIDTGQYINYWIVEGDNAELFSSGSQFRFLKKGKASNDFAKMEPGEGAYHFCFHNDSKVAAVTVTVKITAIIINEKMQSRSVKRMQVTQRSGMHLRN